MSTWLPKEESQFQTGNLHESLTFLYYSCLRFLRDSHYLMAISSGVLLNLDSLTCPFCSLYCVRLPKFLFAQQGLWLWLLKDFLGGETCSFLFSSSSSVTRQMFQQPRGFICHRLPCSLCQWPPGTTF